jgi:serine/threonine-protein kinase
VNAPDPATYTVGYALDAVVARTDHALVFSADARRTGRRVAIKIAHDDLGRDALRREVQVLRGLRHRHVVELVEATALGNPWMVTELAATSLEHLAATHGGLGADELAGVVVGVASALHFVHRHRLVHADVKPANILLHEDGRPVLADFGAAHPIGTAPTQFTPSYFVDDGPEGDVAALARSALHACRADGDGRLDALRTVLGTFARAGDRPDVLIDAVHAIVPEPRWPCVDPACASSAELGESTVPCDPRPPRPAAVATGAAAPRARRTRKVAGALVTLVAIGAIHVARERGHESGRTEHLGPNAAGGSASVSGP